MPDCLLLRADGGPRVGTGHIMRSLALAQGWKEFGGRAVFALAETTPALEGLLLAHQMEIHRLETLPGSLDDARKTASLAHQLGAIWVAGDSYAFDSPWQAAIKDAGLRLVLLDDYQHATRYHADLILNANIYATPALYTRREPHTRLLLGTRYALLRREFLHWRDWTREIPPVAAKILVTLGGSDPDNVTEKVVAALKPLAGIEVLVVIGGSNPHIASIKKSIRAAGPAFRIEINSTQMPDRMAWADIAISAGGGTSSELAWMGLPGIVLILAENQDAVAQALEREGVALNLGRAADWSPSQMSAALSALLADLPLRRRMSQRGRQLIDGYGVDRVITRLRTAGLHLRRARETDCEQIWQWANEPKVRAASFSSAPIPWEDHQRWYAARLAAPDCFFFVATDAAAFPLGVVRFDVRADQEAAISVALAPEARGKGLGAVLVAKGVEDFFAASSATAVHAYIKPGNLSSLRAFERAGFTAAAPESIDGQPALHYVVKGPDR
jgi:UDP-2,4-diacetamido-2,4,6-trideoxy-beta-L-altropyranose hydrolase